MHACSPDGTGRRPPPSCTWHTAFPPHQHSTTTDNKRASTWGAGTGACGWAPSSCSCCWCCSCCSCCCCCCDRSLDSWWWKEGSFNSSFSGSTHSLVVKSKRQGRCCNLQSRLSSWWYVGGLSTRHYLAHMRACTHTQAHTHKHTRAIHT